MPSIFTKIIDGDIPGVFVWRDPQCVAILSIAPMKPGHTLVVIGYGLSERLAPWLLHFQRSISAQGRLEQPLTYWNAMGELAAIGFVLAARVAGDERRGRVGGIPIRAIAGAAAAPLGAGVYLSVSRGALFACMGDELLSHPMAILNSVSCCGPSSST